jgi:hypothetical protein
VEGVAKMEVKAGSESEIPRNDMIIIELAKLKIEIAKLSERLSVLEAEEEQPADIAKQRWEWEDFTTHSELYQIGVDRDECGIATLHMASKEQKAVMEAAPDMLYALESYGDHSAGLAEFCRRKNAAIRKARGGE